MMFAGSSHCRFPRLQPSGVRSTCRAWCFPDLCPAAPILPPTWRPPAISLCTARCQLACASGQPAEVQPPRCAHSLGTRRAEPSWRVRDVNAGLLRRVQSGDVSNGEYMRGASRAHRAGRLVHAPHSRAGLMFLPGLQWPRARPPGVRLSHGPPFACHIDPSACHAIRFARSPAARVCLSSHVGPSGVRRTVRLSHNAFSFVRLARPGVARPHGPGVSDHQS